MLSFAAGFDFSWCFDYIYTSAAFISSFEYISSFSLSLELFISRHFITSRRHTLPHMPMPLHITFIAITPLLFRHADDILLYAITMPLLPPLMPYCWYHYVITPLRLFTLVIISFHYYDIYAFRHYAILLTERHSFRLRWYYAARASPLRCRRHAAFIAIHTIATYLAFSCHYIYW